MTARLNQPPQPVRSAHSSESAGESTPTAARNSPRARSPQELLARWAGNQMFDPYGPIVGPGHQPVAAKSELPNAPASPPAPPAASAEQKAPEATVPARETATRPSYVASSDFPAAPQFARSNRLAPAPNAAAVNTPDPEPAVNHPATTQVLDRSAKVRVDPAFTAGWSDIPEPHTQEPEPEPERRPSAPPVRMPTRQIADGAHAHPPQTLRGPHFDPARLKQRPPTSFRLAAEMGKYLAYLGALILSAGAGLVLWSYMGGPVHYAPTGWFSTVVGQMLLFLGVVTLVSAGMEQTTLEVSRRVDAIAEQLNRLEHSVQSNSAATEAEIEAELRAEIAELRKQLSQRRR